MMLLLGNIHCYADDSTVRGRYLSRPNAGRAVTDEQREFLVNELNRVLELINKWGSNNLVDSMR
jgi:hypothetical protein